VASVGTYGGPIGSSTGPLLKGVQLWVRHINAGGGLNGHPVQLSVFDDGADPTRHRAQVQEAVEKRKVIAFLGNMEVATGAGSVDYINARRIPVIGMDGGEDWAARSPMYFPQMTNGADLYPTYPRAFRSQLADKERPRLGTLVCVEATACGATEKAFADAAVPLGYQLVYTGQISVA
jgi:branched-chain amino acid transport system substrate-binding protein